MGLVEDEDRAQPLVVGGVEEVILEPAHQAGEGPGGFGADGKGDLPTHVALGEPGDLDVVDAIAGLGEFGDQGPKHGRLAGAGGSDERRGHALLDSMEQRSQGLVEGRGLEAIVDADLAGEGDGVEAETALEGRRHGVVSGSGSENPPSASTTGR